MAITTRQSPPPGPPPPFQETRIPDTIQDSQFVNRAEKHRLSLAEEHQRLKPQESMPPKAQIPAVGAAFQEPVLQGSSPANIWPQYRYHRIQAPGGVIVKNAAEEAEKCGGEGWRDTPFPPEVARVQDRLELLDNLLFSLSCVAEGEESRIETLDRIIRERNQFARSAASKKGKSE